MKKNIVIFGTFLLLSLVVTYPLIFHLRTFIIDPVDSLLITWIQNWLIHSPTLNTNIFYPYQNTLAFSDYHLVGAILTAPFIWVFKEPLLAFNINYLAGFVLTAFSSYLLAFHLTKKTPISFLTGVLISFSTLHLNYMAHLQLFSLWLLIFPLLFLFQKRYKFFALLFILASVNSPLNFYILLFFSLIFKSWRHTIWAILLTVPFLLPYYFVSRQFNYSRPITDAINFSLQFPDLANVSVISRLSTFVPQKPGTPAYFGAVFLILILFFLFKKTKSSPWLWGAGLSFILAFGPALHVFRNTIHIGPIPFIPLPYTIFYYLLPGFSGFRTPSRWILVTFICLAFAVAIYFAKKINWKWSLILSLLVLIEVNFPFHYYEIPKTPPEQIWLKDHHVGAPIIQFPIYAWFDGDKTKEETLRMYYSTIHWHPMFNGYSGFSPKEWEEKVRWLQKDFPSVETITYLRSLGIKLVLAPSSWQIPLKSVAEFTDTKVYELY